MKKIWLGVAAGLVAAALVVGAFVLGQRSGGDVTEPPASPSSAVRTPEPGGESPSHDGGRAISKGGVTAGEGGTSEGPGGVMLGYDPTEDGAVQAATNYQAYFHSTAVTDADVRQQVIEAVAVDDAAGAGIERLVSEASKDFDSLIVEMEVESGRGAYAVESFTPEKEAQILLWAPWKIQWKKDDSKDSTWVLGRVTLVWDRGDWKIEEYPPEASVEIPDPADPEGNPSPQEKWALLREPAPEDYEVEEIPEFYRNEWLEYANAAR